MTFKLHANFSPAGDQPAAIDVLVQGVQRGAQNQVLLGVTGSGKTFTMAHVIARIQRPSIILAPNKTLAAQLYEEMRSFFPENAVEYFVSYYDYYQPEAYVPRNNTYIEKESSINDQLDRMRHSATRALLERKDVLIIASVSCIYGIGSVAFYSEMTIPLYRGLTIKLQDLQGQLVSCQYTRNDITFTRGTFRIRGDIVEIFPSHQENHSIRLSFFGDEIESIQEIDPTTGKRVGNLNNITIYPNSHYVTPMPTVRKAMQEIRQDLKKRIAYFEKNNKPLEAQRIRERVTFDLEMMSTTGSCAGIENYSRYLSGRLSGEPPPTLFEYLPKESLVFVDESHISIPQLNGMYQGDAARKKNLSDYGFRLPACKDNRPLKFTEWDAMRPQTIFISATPSAWELEQTQGMVAEQVIRPTGLLDPVAEVRSATDQVDDLIHESLLCKRQNQRVLVTTLTKKMAESLTEYLNDVGLQVRYIHSDVDTLERIEIIRDLRLGIFDVLVGINLLREGLDIPECALVAILDADKSGYLRSKVSLIQTIGRAARNSKGKAILYANTMTEAMREALNETERRRSKQREFNRINGIIPASVDKRITDSLGNLFSTDHITIDKDTRNLTGVERKQAIKKLEQEMHRAAADLDFECAAQKRDALRILEKEQ